MNTNKDGAPVKRWTIDVDADLDLRLKRLTVTRGITRANLTRALWDRALADFDNAVAGYTTDQAYRDGFRAGAETQQARWFEYMGARVQVPDPAPTPIASAASVQATKVMETDAVTEWRREAFPTRLRP